MFADSVSAATLQSIALQERVSTVSGQCTLQQEWLQLQSRSQIAVSGGLSGRRGGVDSACRHVLQEAEVRGDRPERLFCMVDAL